MASAEGYRVYALLNFVGVPLTPLLGYAPGWMGVGEDLPKGVLLEWVGWVMSQRYLFDDPKLVALKNFPQFHGAIRALCLTDDPWATRPAVELPCSGFSSVHPEILSPPPAVARAAKIAPFAVLRPEAREQHRAA